MSDGKDNKDAGDQTGTNSTFTDIETKSSYNDNSDENDEDSLKGGVSVSNASTESRSRKCHFNEAESETTDEELTSGKQLSDVDAANFEIDTDNETISEGNESISSNRKKSTYTGDKSTELESDNDVFRSSNGLVQSQNNINCSTKAALRSADDSLRITPNYLSYLGAEAFVKNSQEPWPKDVKLFQPYEVEQILLPDNANCLSVQAFLKMCGLSYQIEHRPNAEAMSPSGKVPFIKAGAFVVSELEGIVQFVNNRGISLTDKLDTEAKSDMRAYMSLVHNVLENAELYICWCDNETYNDVTSVRHGSIYPWPLNHIQNRLKRNAVIKKLKSKNWYNKTLKEVFDEVTNCCQALSDRLDKKEYFFGEFCELDALVFGHVYSLSTTSLHLNNFMNILQNYHPLLRHCQRICQLLERETDTFAGLLRNSSSKGLHGHDLEVN